MKKNLLVVFSLLLFLGFSFSLKAQCQDFTEKETIPLLGDFTQSGRYNSAKMFEGDELLMYKTVNKGINYRFVVNWSSELPKQVEFEIIDWENKVIYNNKNNKYAKVWDYAPEKTHRIRIIVRVPGQNKSKDAIRGCVSVVTGFKKG